MDIELARRTIRDPRASFVDHYEAAARLTSSSDSTTDDLIECLRRGGICSEIAATTLYVRTNRPRADDSILSLNVDADDWIAYLRKMGQP